MSEQQELLTVQAHDTRLDQLAHKRRTLPERAGLNEVAAERERIQSERAEIEETAGGLRREQKRLEDEIALGEAKIAEENERLYSGDMTSPKEAQAITEEIESLKRRVGDLEEEALGLLIELEPHEERLGELAAADEALDERAERLQADLTVAEAEVDAEVSEVESERASAVAGVGSELLAEYERLRTDLGGVGVAKLENKACSGCHLALSAVEYDRVKKQPTDAIVHCVECGRLLVR